MAERLIYFSNLLNLLKIVLPAGKTLSNFAFFPPFFSSFPYQTSCHAVEASNGRSVDHVVVRRWRHLAVDLRTRWFVRWLTPR